MGEWQSLAHVKWECKYHGVIVPKYRRKTLFGRVRKWVGKVFQQLCRQKDIGLVEGHVMLDHVRMVLSIPPK
jgi:putative transposase